MISSCTMAISRDGSTEVQAMCNAARLLLTAGMQCALQTGRQPEQLAAAGLLLASAVLHPRPGRRVARNSKRPPPWGFRFIQPVQVEPSAERRQRAMVAARASHGGGGEPAVAAAVVEIELQQAAVLLNFARDGRTLRARLKELRATVLQVIPAPRRGGAHLFVAIPSAAC